MIGSLPANAGENRFHLWFGKIPHTVEHLSLCTTILSPVLQSPGAATAEACLLEPVRHTKRSHHNEKPIQYNEDQQGKKTSKSFLKRINRIRFPETSENGIIETL